MYDSAVNLCVETEVFLHYYFLDPRYLGSREILEKIDKNYYYYYYYFLLLLLLLLSITTV